MQIKNTSSVKPNVCTLITGVSGAGKTTLAGTIEGKTLIISAEAGLLSLQDKGIDFIEIEGSDLEKWQQFKEALSFAAKSDYDNIFIDSLSEVSDIIVSYAESEFPDAKNTMQKWGLYTATMKRFIRYVRDIQKNVFITTLQKTDKDEVGKRYYAPDVSGKMAEKMPAFFDLVLNIKVIQKDDEDIRVIQTFTDSGIVCKDRSGKLSRYEKPDLSLILKKIGGFNENKDKAINNIGDGKRVSKMEQSDKKIQSNPKLATKSDNN